MRVGPQHMGCSGSLVDNLTMGLILREDADLPLDL
jgi:hypothetical protein